MKDFSEFKKLLDGEFLQNTANVVNQMQLKISLPIVEENVGDLINAIAAMSTMITVELLEKYHQWLNE